jgi:hypothetical protein
VPGSRHQQVLGGIVRECRPAGNLVPDAHLAATKLRVPEGQLKGAS